MKTAPVHVARDGTWVRTDVADNTATITAETLVANHGRRLAHARAKAPRSRPAASPPTTTASV